jgi:hypothetical protein
MTISLVLAGDDKNNTPSTDLPLRQPAPPTTKEQRKPFFRRRFWALTGGSNELGGSGSSSAAVAETVTKRMIYVPRHAASDFSAMSPGPLHTSLSSQNPKSWQDSSRSSLRSASGDTTPTTIASPNHRPSRCGSPPGDKSLPASKPTELRPPLGLPSPHRHVLKRSISNISALATSSSPLPATPSDFALFAAQARSDRPTDAAAAWSALVKLEKAQRRHSLGSLARTDSGSGSGSVAARHGVAQRRAAVMRRIQVQQVQQQEKAERGFGRRIVAYLRPVASRRTSSKS